MNISFLLSILLFCSISLHSLSQDKEIHVLDLESSINIARYSSYNMLMLHQELKISEYNLKAATSRFKTHIDLRLNAPNYTETIRQFEDSTGITFYPVQRANYGAYLTINQPLPTDGNIYIRSGVNSTSDFYDDKRWSRLNTVVQIEQPLDALFGYNEIKMGFRKAKLDYQRTRKRLKREELNLIYNVSSTFYMLVKAGKEVEIAELNLQRQQEAFQIAQSKYNAGLIREVDALQMEVDLAEAVNQYNMKKNALSSGSNSFKNVIGIPLDDSIVVLNDMNYVVVNVDLDEATSYALNNRPEIREQEIMLELDRMNLKSQKARGRISGDINAYYDMIGIDGAPLIDPISGSLNDAWTDLNERPGNLTVGLTVNIPILDWGENRARVMAIEARIQHQKYARDLLVRNVELEVINLVGSLNSSLRRLEVLSKNIDVAEKSFSITRARYSDGDINSQALALERERLNTAYLSHLSAYIDYELKLTDLMRKTFYDYKNGKPVE